MPTPKPPRKPVPGAMTHLNELLDEALEETFPASDPVAIDVELQPPEIAPAARKKQRAARTHTSDIARRGAAMRETNRLYLPG